MGECNWGFHPPGCLPVGPQVGSDFPLPNATAPAKGPPPVLKDQGAHTPCQAPHTLPIPLQMILSSRFL